jgi:hypothetical protein
VGGRVEGSRSSIGDSSGDGDRDAGSTGVMGT